MPRITDEQANAFATQQEWPLGDVTITQALMWLGADLLDARAAIRPIDTEDNDRHRWQHLDGDEYAPVFGDFWGNECDGFHKVWSRLGEHRTYSLEGAVLVGLREQGSDDFNIAAIRDGEVVALLWMTENLGEEAQVLMDVAEVLGL